MADELDPRGDLPDEGEPGQEAASETRIAELERLVAQRDRELVTARARVNEVEQVVAGKDSEIAALTQSRNELEERLTRLSGLLAEAVSRYRAMVIEANPEVVAELVSGDSIESINESLSQAKALVSKVRQGVEAEISLARVPAGAPERTSPDLSTLSPREKIKYAIGGRR